ncbi:MAG: hypothetical protein HC911_16370 [Chloroflexaceae bacterium]|nr:hypothetical protein [Chloroflexaceae bacterium]
MPYLRERDMYGAVQAWLRVRLQHHYPRAMIRVLDTSQEQLTRVIRREHVAQGLPADWVSWDIHVDITGFIMAPQQTKIAFIECKNKPLTLDHLSQLLGYSRVARPEHALLIAPQGIGTALRSLILTYQRRDVLTYEQQPGQLEHALTLARWDEQRNDLERSTIITGRRAFPL